MSWDFFDAFLYINLRHREDKKNALVKELENQGIPRQKIHRIDAHFNPLAPQKACALSHIYALDFAYENDFERFFIFEDDAVFLTEPKETLKSLKRFEKFSKTHPWDVFFLGTNVKQFAKTDDPEIFQVKASLCTHAYAVNASYLLTLRKRFVDCYSCLWEQNNPEIIFALDYMWIDLQMQGNWYIGKKISSDKAGT